MIFLAMAQKAGYESFADNGITVVIDTNLTPELIEEGFVREFISKVQTTRKDSGFEVMDHIKIGIANNEKLAEIIKKNETEVCEVLLCDELSDCVDENAKEWSINGENVTISVTKI